MPNPLETHKLRRGAGSLVRFSASGNWSWLRWHQRRNGRICRSTGETNLKDAKRWVREQLALEKSRKKKRPTAPILFKTVFEEYVKARRSGERCRRLRASTLKRYRTARNAFQVFVGDRFGQLFLDEIDAASLTRFLETEAERVSATTANATLETIAQVLKFAHKHHFVMENVAEEVERLYDGTDEVADHSDDALIGWPCPKREEVREIILHAPPTLEKTGAKASDGRPIYRGIGRNDYTNLYGLLSRTGLRIGEARFLTWDDVDFERKVIDIHPGIVVGRAN